MKSKKILVTGGTGFIGSHTVVELLEKDFEVIIADDLSNSRKEVVESIEKITGRKPVFVQVDLCDANLTNELFKKYSPDAVIHFAAKKLVGESVDEPLMYYRTNLFTVINIISACREYNCKGIVFSSSCTVYGQPDDLPVRETSELKPAESPYGNTKKIAEDILRDSAGQSNFNVISLRYFNPVGAHHTALIGEYPLGSPSNLMPIMTQTAIGIRPSFFVFGNDYNTPDGTCIRDYIHVTDLAIAHVIAIEKLLGTNDLPSYDVYNIGTGKGVSVFEMIEKFEKVNKLKLNYTVTQRRPGDVEQVWADTTKANTVLGWKAAKGIDEMVISAWQWEQHIRK